MEEQAGRAGAGGSQNAPFMDKQPLGHLGIETNGPQGEAFFCAFGLRTAVKSRGL